MNQRRVDFYLGAVGECLIAVGGRNDNGALSSVEVYSPADDCWTYVAGLPRCELTLFLYNDLPKGYLYSCPSDINSTC